LSIRGNRFYNRLLAKLADASEVQGVSGTQNRTVHEELENARTEATEQFAAAVELSKKSNISNIKQSLQIVIIFYVFT